MPETPSNAEGVADVFERRYEFAERYYGDESLRARVGTAEPEETLSQLGIDLPEDVETRIVANSGDVTYFVFPPDPNARLSDESLSGVAGGLRGRRRLRVVAGLLRQPPGLHRVDRHGVLRGVTPALRRAAKIKLDF